MKIPVTFKTPDALDYALNEHLPSLDENEEGWEKREEERAEAKEQFEKFIRYGELVTVTLDTDTGKMEVQEC